MKNKYKYKCYWDRKSGWNFSLGKKRLWEKDNTFVVATVNPDTTYSDFEYFTFIENALSFMRDGQR